MEAKPRSFELFNFDHGQTSAKEIKIGPYAIAVSDEHCANLALLARHGRTHFFADPDQGRQIERDEKVVGEFAVTAKVLVKGESEPSQFFPSETGATSDYDLVLLLSFLTGRHVYFEADLVEDPRRHYEGPVVGTGFFDPFPQEAWTGRGRVATAGLADALYCLVNANATRELIGKGAYLNASFDTVVSVWAKKAGRTKYPDRPSLDNGLQAVEEWLVGVRAKVAEKFRSAGVTEDVIDDMVARIRASSNGPSAVMKMTSYLQESGLFPNEPTEEQLKRLKGFNAVRNAIAHSGAVRWNKELGQDVIARVAASALAVIAEVVELALARQLGVFDHRLIKQSENVVKFFETGVFRGHAVFEEDIDAFLERISKEWIEDGTMN
jgi:hypothetical protein